MVLLALAAGNEESSGSRKVFFFLTGDSITTIDGGWGDGLI
jgi:hypothetical protein